MNYAIKGTEVNITDELRSYVEKRLQSLDKFGGGAARAEVELAYQELHDGPRYRAELMYHEPGEELKRAEARGTTLHEAIDVAGAELLRQLSASKQKKHDVFRRTALRVKEYLRGWRTRV